MGWTVCAVALLAAFGFSSALLIQRAFRQAKVAATLRIETTHGIVEERFVRICGIDQWIGIRGEDRENPVLLVLHGGPGCSYSIFSPHLRAWEKHFTIVQWDQRGSGKTLGRTGKRNSEPLNFDQLTKDAAEVAEYARNRLGKERVFLLASSLGSTFGIRLAHRRPDLFYAFIGTDQNVGMKQARGETHRELLERLRALGLEKGRKVVERIGADPAHWTVGDFEVTARWTMRADTRGFGRTMKLLKDAVWCAPGWRLIDILAFAVGMRFSLQKLLPEIVLYDAWEEGLDFEIPVFIFQGEDDVLTTPKLARAFLDDVIAPLKQFRLIADAGHFAAFLQPEQFLRQLLTDVRPLADASHPAGKYPIHLSFPLPPPQH
jgi:pimeloyl-ACP methyl ester carboxylesterase